MKHTVHTSDGDAKAQQSRVTKLMGYPAPGRSAATGELVEPDNPGGLGWTMRYGEVTKHPDRDEWATAAGPEVDAALLDAGNDKLSGSEKTETKAAADAAVKLPADWEPEDAVAATEK